MPNERQVLGHLGRSLRKPKCRNNFISPSIRSPHCTTSTRATMLHFKQNSTLSLWKIRIFAPASVFTTTIPSPGLETPGPPPIILPPPPVSTLFPHEEPEHLPLLPFHVRVPTTPNDHILLQAPAPPPPPPTPSHPHANCQIAPAIALYPRPRRGRSTILQCKSLGHDLSTRRVVQLCSAQAPSSCSLHLDSISNKHGI